MTALSHSPFSVTPALALFLGLCACSAPEPKADDPSDAPGAPPVQASEQGTRPAPAAFPPAAAPAPAAPSPAEPPVSQPARWDVSRTRDGATATLLDARGAVLRIICMSAPPRLRVDAPTLRPAVSQERLTLALGSEALPMNAEHGPGGVTAQGRLPPNIAARILRAETIEAHYGPQVAGPFTPPRGADAMTLANACEEAVSPAPPRPAPPMAGDARREQIPVAFRGEWNARLQDCGSGRHDSRLAVGARTLGFYESRGEVTGVTRRGLRSITVEARYTGEGRTWDRSIQMTLNQEGDRLTVDGAVRQRCPADGGANDTPPGR